MLYISLAAFAIKVLVVFISRTMSGSADRSNIRGCLIKGVQLLDRAAEGCSKNFGVIKVLFLRTRRMVRLRSLPFYLITGSVEPKFATMQSSRVAVYSSFSVGLVKLWMFTNLSQNLPKESRDM
jgi:hypothetical protein